MYVIVFIENSILSDICKIFSIEHMSSDYQLHILSSLLEIMYPSKASDQSHKKKNNENKNSITDHSWESPEYKNQISKGFLSQS